MDRYTPFDAGQVYSDFRIIETNTAQKRVRVELAVVRRQVANQALSVARSVGLERAKLLVADDQGRIEPFQFLPSGSTKGRHGAWRIAGVVIAATLFVAFSTTAVYLPIKHKRDALATSEAELARVRAQAEEVSQVRSLVTDMSERGSYVLDRRRLRPTRTELVDELSALLPDDTWLFALRLSGDRLELTGYSAKASELVATLENSPLFAEAHFTAPVAPDPRFSAQRFSLTASVLERSE